VVDLSESLRSGGLGALAVAPDRSIYFTESTQGCYRGGCPHRLRLRHYLADGTLDPRFHEADIAGAMAGEYLLVDPAGRPLLAWERHSKSGPGGIVIRRFRRGGALDRSFGDSGTVFLGCGCYFESLALAFDGDLIASGYWEGKRAEGGGRARSKWLLARLRPDGKRDRGFGREGDAWFSLPAHYPPDQIVPFAGGNFLGGFRSRGYDASAPYVMRLSNRGHLARRFAAEARRSLTGLYQTNRESVGWEDISLIPRAGGSLEVYGAAYRKGVAVRLLSDGRRDRSFGRDGVILFPFELNDAVADGSRGTLAVGYKRGRYSVLRVDRWGQVDPRFGRVGLPGAYNEYGLQIFPAGKGSAVVLARGESTCRYGCEAEPRLYRVLR
jgi:hypothetical protein